MDSRGHNTQLAWYFMNIMNSKPKVHFDTSLCSLDLFPLSVPALSPHLKCCLCLIQSSRLCCRCFDVCLCWSTPLVLALPLQTGRSFALTRLCPFLFFSCCQFRSTLGTGEGPLVMIISSADLALILTSNLEPGLNCQTGVDTNVPFFGAEWRTPAAHLKTRDPSDVTTEWTDV